MCRITAACSSVNLPRTSWHKFTKSINDGQTSVSELGFLTSLLLGFVGVLTLSQRDSRLQDIGWVLMLSTKSTAAFDEDCDCQSQINNRFCIVLLSR